MLIFFILISKRLVFQQKVVLKQLLVEGAIIGWKLLLGEKSSNIDNFEGSH
jgi:hypothetical protein